MIEFFRQNNELTIPQVELVKDNIFLSATVEDNPLPLFSEKKHLLPKPIWKNHDSFVDCYYKAWELAFSKLRKPATDSGFKSNFIDCAFNDWIFMWDTAFMLMFGKYGERVFSFQKSLDNFYSHQHKDGFICREICESDGKDRFTRYDPSATGPEVLAWCEWEYYQNFKDIDRLSAVFTPLLTYHMWMAEHHTWPDGTYFSSGWGCGMDNIPRQKAGRNPDFSHGHMIWVDVCMQALNDCNALINMAKELGRTEFLEDLTTERDHLNSVINNKLWDEKTGFYYDLWNDGCFNGVRHIGAFWALLAECAPKERAERMISYLKDENEFNTPNKIPALSKSSPYYHPSGNYWCGGVWSPTTYMVLKGLEKYNAFSLAHKIALDHLNSVVEVYKDTGTLFENYAPEYIKDGKPSKGGRSRPDFVGWTGLSPISILFEFVFGIKSFADLGKIVWDINLLDRHGIEKYPFGPKGEITLICDERICEDEKPSVTIISNIPITIEIIWGREGKKQSMIINT